eukprot:1142172-Pelagomonas_calceolata.AAC.1
MRSGLPAWEDGCSQKVVVRSVCTQMCFMRCGKVGSDWSAPWAGSCLRGSGCALCVEAEVIHEMWEGGLVDALHTEVLAYGRASIPSHLVSVTL